MLPKLLCSVIIREKPSKDSAEKFIDKFADCPYIAFLAHQSNKVFIVSFIPEGHWWWIEEWVKEVRKVYKEKTALFRMDKVSYPREFHLRIPRQKQELAPCGTNCKTCEFFTKCACCPATIYYKGINFKEKVE